MKLSTPSFSAFLLPALAQLAAAESFSLYAYGDSLGGLALYYADGKAVVSASIPSNATDVSRVTFTKEDSNGLLGNPPNDNHTTGDSGSLANQLLYVPSSSATSKQVGLTADAGADQVTSRFVWYGNSLLVEDESGEYTSLFSVKKSSSDDGEYALL
ncbi:uncharacterized protein BO97DRAFT_422580 [Aspergillus homomorphus CBS 101889]|uniref:Uncharacterized protein n=1 Tax=Aspergillus homomorphus (strain CBS 101889) TaxID=1450537 RepID=A0A395I670_ASPHC|nr:hypothetical protein BO97DRAFT_422580 [Aspergillus homomorphus CBS 101889]RAL14688.1 hypothetical protein BO97DRAFT_422580 [Aspergillus homomorphus CBS 101889]